MKTTRTLSTAETAKEVRKALKAAGIKPLSVRSRNYANGSSVDVIVTKEDFRSQPAWFWQDLQRFTYGTFNPMNDSFEYCGSRLTLANGEEVAPGAKYLSVQVVE